MILYDIIQMRDENSTFFGTLVSLSILMNYLFAGQQDKN